MKKTLFILLGALTLQSAQAQVPMRRIIEKTAHSADWIPQKEKTGNLVKFSTLGTKKLGVTLRCRDVAWAGTGGLQSRGFQYVTRLNGTVPATSQLAIPGTHESGPYATTLGKPATQWTQAECYNFGRNVTTVVGLTSDQYGEGYSAEELSGYIDTRSNQYRWVYEGMRDKAATMTPRPVLIGSYETKFDSYQSFRPGGGAWNPDTQANRDALLTAQNARQGIWWFGLPVSKYVMPIYQVYPGIPSDELLYLQAYGVQRLQKAGEAWGDPGYTISPYTFIWPQFSSHGYVHPFEHDGMTGGKFYQHQTGALSFETLVSLCLNTYVLTGRDGGVYIWEDTVQYTDVDPNKVTTDYSGIGKPADIWKPFTNAPRPTSTATPNAMPERPNGIYSAPIVAAEMYGELVAAGGENFRFARFKIGNGAWIEPGAGESTILQAAAQFRGWCRICQNGANYGIYYTNPRAPLSGETITVDLGDNRTVSFDCFGKEPVVVAGSHPGGGPSFTRNSAL